MKKYYYLSFIALIAILVAGCKPDAVKTVNPVITVENELVAIEQQGGICEIKYTIENPMQNGVVSAFVAEETDWITDLDYSTPDVVTFNVAANTSAELKEAVVTIEYVWSKDKVTKEISLIQEAKYDYELEAESLIGWYYTDETMYEFYLSDLGAKDGKFQPNGHYYNFIVPSTVPDDYTAISLPEGTYRIGEAGMYEPMYIVWNSDLTEKTETTLESGILTVTKEGDTYVYVARMKDAEGKNHYVRYAKNETMTLTNTAGYRLIDHDVEVINPFVGRLSYMDESEDGEVMRVGLQFSYANEDYTESSIIYMELYTPKDEIGEKLAGTYNVATTMANYTIMPASIDMETLTILGSYCMDINKEGNAVGLISEGTLTITPIGNGEYEAKADFRTAEGFRMTTNYTGPLAIPNVPGSLFSTLTEDYIVDMSTINYTFGGYWGDKYKNNTAYWKLEMEGTFDQDPNTFLTSGKGEKVYIEVITAPDSYASGIATGTYTAAKDPENPQPGEYIPGSRGAGQSLLEGTYYIGAYEEGYVSHSAPALGGELHITNNGESNYTIDFCFEDGKDHTWSGNWTGHFGFLNWADLFGAQLHQNEGLGTMDRRYRH